MLLRDSRWNGETRFVHGHLFSDLQRGQETDVKPLFLYRPIRKQATSSSKSDSLTHVAQNADFGISIKHLFETHASVRRFQPNRVDILCPCSSQSLICTALNDL